jgi:3-dehydroquinate dehydratase
MKLLPIQGANMEYRGRRQPELYGYGPVTAEAAVGMIAGYGVDSWCPGAASQGDTAVPD